MTTAGEESKRSVYQKLLEVQRELKVEKAQYNSFGGFSYRSKEDILEAAKPLCHERGLVILCNDRVDLCGGWVYITTVAEVVDVETGACVVASGLAREQETKKGMDAAQITGTASSYAGKRALGNLFALDDTKDADAPMQDKQAPENGPFNARCKTCGQVYTFENIDQYNGWLAYLATGNPEGRCCPNPSYEVM